MADEKNKRTKIGSLGGGKKWVQHAQDSMSGGLASSKKITQSPTKETPPTPPAPAPKDSNQK